MTSGEEPKFLKIRMDQAVDRFNILIFHRIFFSIFSITLFSVVTEIMTVFTWWHNSLLKPFKWIISLNLHLPFMILEGATIWPCLQMRKLNPKEGNLLIDKSHLSPEATFFTVCVEDPDAIFTSCQSRSVQSSFGEQDYSPLVWGKSLVVYSKHPIIDITLGFGHHKDISSLRRREEWWEGSLLTAEGSG